MVKSLDIEQRVSLFTVKADNVVMPLYIPLCMYLLTQLYTNSVIYILSNNNTLYEIILNDTRPECLNIYMAKKSFALFA